jgi:aspartate/methionine/tyrosine aminotransferase
MGLIRERITTLEDSPIVDIWRLILAVPDVIALWAGEPDTPTPPFICEAASKALFEGHTFYSPNRGIPELRQALIEYHQRLYGVDIPEQRITLTSSGMNAVMLVAQATVQPGDNVVVVTPSWPNIMRAMQINGAAIREAPLSRGNNGWSLDLDRVFELCDEHTRVIYTASPGNPTGWMIPREQAEALLDFARLRNIALLSDEVYHRIVYDGNAAFSLLQIARPDDPVFVVNSFSKSWAMTGWRLGWMVFPEGLAPAMEKLIQFNTSGGQAFLQYGAIAALREGEEFVSYFVDRCRQGREVVNERLAAMPRIHNIPNNGSFYAMFEADGVMDSFSFCRRAVTEARIGMAPGSAFGRGAERMVRLCYAKTPELLHSAMDRLQAFVGDYKE